MGDDLTCPKCGREDWRFDGNELCDYCLALRQLLRAAFAEAVPETVMNPFGVVTEKDQRAAGDGEG